MKNIPANSHIQGDYVFPLFGYYLKNQWGWSDVFTTYFLLRDNTDKEQLSKGLSEIAQNGIDFYKLNQAKVILQPLKDIHLEKVSAKFDNSVSESKSLVVVFASISLIILVLSCINFANLFVSTSFIRARSIGIRKSQGATKWALIRDFYLETAYYVLTAIIIGIALTYFTLPVFNQFVNSGIEIDFTSPIFYIYIIVLFVFTTLLAGSFPAVYMTKFNIIETLSGKFRGKRVSLLQKSLIIIQFSVSIILLTVVVFIYKQIDFMVSHDKGFNTEHIITVNDRDKFGENFESFRTEMMQETSIIDVTKKNSLPTNWVQGWGFSLPDNLEVLYNAEVCRIKPNYFDFFDMKIIEGENPLYLDTADSLRICVINESAVKVFGLTAPVVGKIIVPNGDVPRSMTIAGVVKDAQTRSFHSPVDPQVYIKLGSKWTGPIFFKIKGDPERALNKIEQKWKAEIPLVPFEYLYMDTIYHDLYKADTNSGKVLLFAMFITIIITVAGLFAMAYYSTQRRIKEIGLRKVNGATTSDLIKLLNQNFIIWVLTAFVIACPISYFALNKWLDDYMIRTSLDWWIFALIGLLAVMIALITVSYQTWKVATMNPVIALKND
ncbi:ABC transporter permease [Dysgonomonas macrotermitis]|uniref:Putative ABC transport system permease protein n=1 Tax=Dysgonomonas macrotermitis TaxID=1346286 RepID=A0A1M5G6M7_9BACT|nr:FtsX-like permease family protein [Dysgonomonas macrotermitis]SHF99379.1 putative ABC transport system permease protein [Dysgonomonas macrotermitis]